MHAFLANNISSLPSPKLGEGRTPQGGVGEVGGEYNNSPDILEIHPDLSIGIAEIRQIHHFLSRKPIQNPRNTVIIHDAHLMTIPAQNAFLKTLEEPPGNSRIYLITAHPDQLLPTILSRVQIINNKSHVSYPSNQNYRNLFSQLLSSGVGERLVLIEKQNFTRQTALEFLDDLELIFHENIIQKGSLHLTPYALRLILKTRRYLQANVNVTLALDHFAINLPQ